MRQLTIGGGPAGTLLVVGDSDNPVPVLISNVDPVNIVYIGEDVGLNPAFPLSCTPLPPGQYIVASGNLDVFGIAAPGQNVAVNVYTGMMSFFQPLTQLVVSGLNAGVLIYSPSQGQGNLVGSWVAPPGFTDQYGNVVPPGLNATGGSLSSMTIDSSTITNTIIQNALIQGGQIANAAISSGSIYETAITFDTGGGGAFLYATTTTTVSFSTPGNTSWASPVTGPAIVRSWGADAGAGGGSSIRGGEGGGAGAFGGEPAYNLVQGQNYIVTVGQGGTGGSTGKAGQSGGDSGFDNFGVLGNGGNAGINGVGGIGGSKSPQTSSFAGGNGGGDGSQSTGGCGGGGRAGSSGPGGNGSKSTSATGANGGTAGSGIGGHAGGNGGNNGANGNSPSGGCGAATSATTGTSTYNVTYSASYYGADASGGNANQERNYGSPMYQGGTTASGGGYNGTMKSIGFLGPGNPQSDLAGKTIDSVQIALNCQHSWYGSGMYAVLGYNGRSSLPSPSWDASDITPVTSFWIAPGGYSFTDITGYGLGTALQSGAAKCITLGPGTPNMNAYNYGYFSGAGSSYPPAVQVNWHTGAAPVKAANGANGLVQVTYQNTTALVGALSPVAGTDASSNAFGIGYTGPVQAFTPATAPTTVETWHSLTPLPSGLTGSARYKLVAEANCVLLDLSLQWTGTTTATFTLPNLPAQYTPSLPGALARVYPMTGNSAITAVGQFPRLFVNGPSIQLIVPATSGGGTATFTGILPVN